MNAQTFVVVMSKPGVPPRFTHTHAFTTVVVPTWGVQDEQSAATLQAAFADNEWVLETSKHVQALVASSVAQALARAFAQKGIVFQTDIVETPS
jgi:hypothetical protein